MARLTMLKPRLQPFQAQRIRSFSADSWRAGKTTAERGYGARWQRARVRHLTAFPLCAYCQREGKVEPATVVDHVVPHRGDRALFWDESNWQSLCTSHHSALKQREEREG